MENILDTVSKDHSLFIREDELRSKVKLRCDIDSTILPIEKKSIDLEWPENILPNISETLHKKYPIIDVHSILAMKGKPHNRVDTPRFAFYDVFGSGFVKVSTRDNEGHYKKFNSKNTQGFSNLRLSVAISGIVVSVLFFIISANLSQSKLLILPVTVAVLSLASSIFSLLTIETIDTFSSTFKGLIPSKTKEKIKEAREICGSMNFYILKEQDKWNAETRVIGGDPLLIGTYKNVYYLIDKFDTTTYEEYVSKEFSA